MVFNYTRHVNYKPTRSIWVCWFCAVIIALIVIIPVSKAMDLNEIEKQIDKYTNMYMFGVSFNRKRSKYLTFSGVSGKKLFTTTSHARAFFSSYAKDVRFNMLTYPEFDNFSKQLIPRIKYFQHLPKTIGKYIDLLEIKALDLTINYVVISNDNKVFKVTDWIPVSKKIDLTFYGNIHADQIEEFSKYVEPHMINTFPHELFHFLIGYQNHYKLKEIREEVFAHLFGRCVAYEIYPIIHGGMDTMQFSDDYFDDPVKDLKKLRKKMKKRKYFNSRIAEGVSLYYFQAIANNYSGENIHSDKIPKFCQKLFSEHNFKHPIEKKPPIWFKDFLKSQNADSKNN